MTGLRFNMPLPRLRGWPEMLAVLVASRLVLATVGAIAPGLADEPGRRLDVLADQPWLSAFVQWDAAYYLDVALRGYSFVPGEHSNIAFFPFYPWLIRLVAAPFGRLTEDGAALAGLAIANVALVVAMVYVAALLARDFSPEVARRGLLYLLLLPTTLFLSAAYPESLVVAAGAGSLYHARRGEWYRSGMWAGVAALTRPFGFILLLPLVLEMARRRPPLRALPALLLPPAGLGVYALYLWATFGDPTIYFDVGIAWGRELTWPLEPLAGYLHGPLTLFDWPYSVIDLVSMAVIVVLAVLGWRLLPLSYAAFATAGVVFLASSGIAWFSAPRHALAMVPLLAVLALLGERRAFHWPWLALSIALAIGFMARFAAGHWVS